MAPTDPLAVAAAAARGFQLFQCQECAESIRNALAAAGHGGQMIELRARGGRGFMICLSYDGGQTTITQNRRHVGVRVGDMAFDNLHPGGMPFDEWLRDFDAIGGVVVSSTTSF